ncbi:hypothetical protein OG579_17030 [Williamsia herbipolensis]|uniref:Portal protein n=1 Tax=Williamsia herbipolensis TaxID=1603258 RepID=A0AAU4K013_9NOCA|nr:hypothetical protein [Williamsia herbipolensis]
MPRPESSSRIIASSALAIPRRRRARSQLATSTIPIVDGLGRARGSITAAAQALTGPKASVASKVNTEQWQTEVWGLRHEVPELRFVADRQASAASQCRLFIGQTPKPGDEPVPLDDSAPQVLRELNESMFGQLAQTQQAMFRAAQQVVNGGETELLVSVDDDQRWSWSAWAPNEVTGSAVTGWAIREGTQSRPINPDRELLVRSWRPAPEQIMFADSPVRSLLPVLRELVSLTKYVSAQMDSRLAGAGLLLVPAGIKPMGGQFDEQNKTLTFAQALAETMMVPLVDRDDASSMVPLIAEVEPALIEKIRHITFASTLDPHAAELRSELIRRIGLGMDTDPSVLLGQGEANHWSGWLIAEDEVRLSVAPVAAIICHSLTQFWLSSLLTEMGLSPADAARYQVWFDASPLELRPDRSKDAQTLHTQRIVGAATARRESGFNDGDAPTAEELRYAVLQDLLTARPELAEAILPAMGINLALPEIVTPTTPALPPDRPAPDPAPAPSADDKSVQFGAPDTLDDGPPQ